MNDSEQAKEAKEILLELSAIAELEKELNIRKAKVFVRFLKFEGNVKNE